MDLFEELGKEPLPPEIKRKNPVADSEDEEAQEEAE